MNNVSSRSHLISIIKLQQKNTSSNTIVKSKLFLVDLAGSERLSKTEATGERSEEAKLINRSLMTLG